MRESKPESEQERKIPPDLAEKIWATLVALFAEQNGVTVEYDIVDGDEGEKGE